MSPESPITQYDEPKSSKFYRRQDSITTWKLISAILGIILVGGTIISSMGKAFYVTRTEYTEKTQRDAVDQVYLNQTLEQVKKSLNDQQLSFKMLSDTVYELKLNLVKRRP
jgi:heme/copper-type cytochrome/quinol oxidase subunit 1